MANCCRRFQFLKVIFSLIVFSLPLDVSTEASGLTATSGYTTSVVPSTTTARYCIPNMKNIAVREGTIDVPMNVTSNACDFRLSVTPALDLYTRYINYDCTVYPTMANLYYVNRSGLIIRNSTITENGQLIATAGHYLADCQSIGNPSGSAKFLVIRSGPDCSCMPYRSSSNVDLSCRVSFVDNPLNPIPAIMTWKVNGTVYTTDTPYIDKTAYVFTAVSTITVDAGNADNYQCVLTFGQPANIQYDYVATNPPEFSASCSPSVCVNGTTQTTTQQATEILEIPISMEPSFGPVAGGTNLTIIIGSETIDYISIYVGSNNWAVSHVYFGEHLSSTLVSLQTSGSSTFEFLVVTPKATVSPTGQPLPVIIEFSLTTVSMTPFNTTSNRTFTYLPNPEITGIYPNNFITSGGTLLDVFGQSLSSVAKPIIQLKIIINRTAEDGSAPNITTTTTSRVCTVPPGNDTYMQCPMPPLNLPEDLLEIINSLYNINVTRRRRSGDPINLLIANSHSYPSRLKRDVNVLTVNSSDGRDQAKIFLGFIFDGYREYENINDAFPDTRINFYSAPEINSSDELIQFDPSEDELIYVKGRYMSRGCRLIDYVVHIGSEICTNNDLQANQLSCRPPKVEPSSTDNDTIHCAGSDLSITITVGYKQYQYACLTYKDHSRRLALIIGLTVGLGVFAILLTILVICIVRCRKSKVREETDIFQHSRGVELRNRHTQNAERPGSKRDLNIIHTRQNPMTIYKTDYDHETVLQQESQHDYDKQIQEYDDYLKPNGDYLTSIDDE